MKTPPSHQIRAGPKRLEQTLHTARAQIQADDPPDFPLEVVHRHRVVFVVGHNALRGRKSERLVRLVEDHVHMEGGQ